MRILNCTLFLLALLAQFSLVSCGGSLKSLSNNKVVFVSDLHLDGIKNGEDRYRTLHELHCRAVNEGFSVSYEGCDTITLVLPENVKSMPLRGDEDFAGVTFQVKNTSRDVFLFSLSGTSVPIAVDKTSIDSGVFTLIPELCEGKKVLVVTDTRPWVENRIGYNYGATRKDVLVLKDGRAVNSVISAYNNAYSEPECVFFEYGRKNVSFGGLTFVRDTASTFKTMLIKIENIAGFKVDNVVVRTPDSKLYGDGVFTVKNCADFIFDNITIDGTYSLDGKYGYGFNLNGVYNCKFSHLDTFGKWGVFGTNNVSEWLVEDSKLNRVDIHCYGRNVTCRNCDFRDRYCGFSSVYGTAQFEKCTFTNFTPYINAESYNAYTPIDIYYSDCVWNVDAKHTSFIEYWNLDEKPNSRAELVKKCLPGIHIKNMTVNISEDVSQITLLKIKRGKPEPLGYMPLLDIKGMKFSYNSNIGSASLALCSQKIDLEGDFRCRITDLDIIAEKDAEIVQGEKKYTYPGSMIINIHGQTDEVTVIDSRLNYNVNSNYEYNIAYKNCTIGYMRATPYNLNGYGDRRRTYTNCRLYLNCTDSKKYYLDNLAEYDRCTFIPCSDKELDFWGSKIEVDFNQCTTAKNGGVSLRGVVVSNMKASAFDGKTWRKK